PAPTVAVAAGCGGGPGRRGGGGAAPAGRGPGGVRGQWAGRPAGRGAPAPGRVVVAPDPPGYGPGRRLLPAGAGDRPAAAGPVLGAARRAEPEPLVAAARQACGGLQPARANLWLVHRGL